MVDFTTPKDVTSINRWLKSYTENCLVEKTWSPSSCAARLTVFHTWNGTPNRTQNGKDLRENFSLIGGENMTRRTRSDKGKIRSHFTGLRKDLAWPQKPTEAQLILMIDKYVCGYIRRQSGRQPMRYVSDYYRDGTMSCHAFNSVIDAHELYRTADKVRAIVIGCVMYRDDGYIICKKGELPGDLDERILFMLDSRAWIKQSDNL